MRILPVIITLTLLTSSVWADGVSVNLIEGNTVIPIQNNNIRMLSEVVKISEDAKVTADFVFENLSDASVPLKMGFPVVRGDDSFIKFKAWVNGKSIKVTLSDLSQQKESILKNQYKDFKRLDMFVWNVSFQKREKKNVRVEYMGQWGSDPRTYPEQKFVYITRTGALWSENIGKADFYMTLPDDIVRTFADESFRYKLRVKPIGYKKRANKIEWHFTNWKPTVDIEVSVEEKRK